MADIIHPNLPADLPTDWNTAQYVSPNGTEVGLSEARLQLPDAPAQRYANGAEYTGPADRAGRSGTGGGGSITPPPPAPVPLWPSPAPTNQGGHLSGPGRLDGGGWLYFNGQPLTLTDLNGEPVKNGWKQGAPVSLSISGGTGYFAAGASGFLPLEGGTLTGPAVGAAGEIAMPQFRNVQYGTEALIPGVSPLPQGMLYITPEAGGAELTAQEILDKLKTVDGAGSGLDADLLDGKQAVSLQRGIIRTRWLLQV